MVRDRSILLTGATGFLGRHLARLLIAEGWSVHALIHRRADQLPAECIAHPIGKGVGDLVKIFKVARPEVVVHLATNFVAEHGQDDVEPIIEANVAFGCKVLEAMKVVGVRRLISADSAWQYSGRHASPAVTFYAASKSAFNVFLDFFADAEGFAVLSLVVPDTYGPDDGRGKLVERLLSCARGAEPLNLSPGDQTIDLLHVDDVVAGFRDALARIFQDSVGGRREIFALTSGAPVRVRDVVSLVELVTAKGGIANLGARPYRRREIMEAWRPANTLPNWKPRVSLKDGIGTIWRSFTAK